MRALFHRSTEEIRKAVDEHRAELAGAICDKLRRAGGTYAEIQRMFMNYTNCSAEDFEQLMYEADGIEAGAPRVEESGCVFILGDPATPHLCYQCGETREKHGCRHLTGYWINRTARNFRCYLCGSQFHIGDNLPADHPQDGIEDWIGTADRGYRGAAPRVEEQPPSVCPNCGQWQYWTSRGYKDCVNDCAQRGFAPRVEEDSLRDLVRAGSEALDGDSNDAEHDALHALVEFLGVDLADLVAVAREIANDPRCDLVSSERRIRLYAALQKLSALDLEPAPRVEEAAPGDLMTTELERTIDALIAEKGAEKTMRAMEKVLRRRGTNWNAWQSVQNYINRSAARKGAKS